MTKQERFAAPDFGPAAPNAVGVRVRLGAYAPTRRTAVPGNIEKLALPPHLRAEPQATLPNRADRRRAMKRLRREQD